MVKISAKKILKISAYIILRSDTKTKWPEYKVEDTADKMVRTEDTKN